MLRLICSLAVLLAVSCTPEEPPTVSPAPEEPSIDSPVPVPEDSETASAGDAPIEKADRQYRLVPKIFWIKGDAAARIPYRVLDAVNAVRSENDLSSVKLSSELTAAARTHARDMSVQNRPWHFGSDGSSPISRAAKAGYEGRVLGENISESFESDLETLAAWMQDSEARNLILKPGAVRIGIGWYQETEGKIWWSLVVGA